VKGVCAAKFLALDSTCEFFIVSGNFPDSTMKRETISVLPPLSWDKFISLLRLVHIQERDRETFNNSVLKFLMLLTEGRPLSILASKPKKTATFDGIVEVGRLVFFLSLVRVVVASPRQKEVYNILASKFFPCRDVFVHNSAESSDDEDGREMADADSSESSATESEPTTSEEEDDEDDEEEDEG
jgi:hypothetical protein